MRVAYVSADPGVPVFGSKGCSVHVQEVIRAMRRAGVEVELHTVRTGGTAPADLESVEVFEIPFDRKGGREAIEERRLLDHGGLRIAITIFTDIANIKNQCLTFRVKI